jgi:hypothetical protein
MNKPGKRFEFYRIDLYLKTKQNNPIVEVLLPQANIPFAD